jgi:arginine decarboxylase
MEVEVVWGSAGGRTELGALDGAFAAAGIHDYNLVELSSVVPGGATVVEVGTHERTAPRGTAMAVVLAEAVVPADEAAVAGLGWHLAAEGGVFYESSGRSVEHCRETIRRGLADARGLRAWDWASDPNIRIQDHSASGPTASVVAAVLGEVSTDWP